MATRDEEQRSCGHVPMVDPRALAPRRSAMPPRTRSRNSHLATLVTRCLRNSRNETPSSAAATQGVTDLCAHLERGIATRETLARSRPSCARSLRVRNRYAHPDASSRDMDHCVTDSRAHLERGRRRFARAMGGARGIDAKRRSQRDTRATRATRRLRARDRDTRTRNAFARAIATRVRTRPRSPWNMESPTRARISCDGVTDSRAIGGARGIGAKRRSQRNGKHATLNARAT